MPEIWRDSIGDGLTAVVTADESLATGRLFVFDEEGVERHRQDVLITSATGLDYDDHAMIWRQMAAEAMQIADRRPDQKPPSAAARILRIIAFVGFAATLLALASSRSLGLSPITIVSLVLVVVAGLMAFTVSRFIAATRQRDRRLEILWGALAFSILLTAGVAFSPSLGTMSAVRPPDVWSSDISRAVHFATSSHRVLVVYIYDPGCVYCYDLDRDSLHTLGLADISDCCVFLRIDAGTIYRQSYLAFQTSTITIVPAVIVFRKYGSKFIESGRLVGYYPPEDFLNRLTALIRQARSGPVSPRDV